MGKWFSTSWKIFKASENAHYGWLLLEHVLDLRGWIITAGVFFVTFFGGALEYLRSPLDVWLGALIAATCAAILYVVGCFIFDRRASRRAAKKGRQGVDVEADIDAREAFFAILESSEWRDNQMRTTTDTSHLVQNWLDVRLDTEIHDALRNSKLNAWGRESLPGTQTTPEKPIPPDAWDKVEISFDRSTLPRTAAHFKGLTHLQRGPMAWVGIRFSRQQIFELFPLAERRATPAATVPSAPYYTRDDVDQMLTAMRRISVLLNQTAVDARDSVQDLMNQWAHILDKKGKTEFIAEMDRSQEKVDAVINETWAIVKDYRHYHDEVGPVLSAANFSGLYHQAIAEFRNAVSMLPGESGFGATLNLVMPQRDAFARSGKALQDWMTGVFDRLEATTKRLRALPHNREPAQAHIPNRVPLFEAATRAHEQLHDRPAGPHSEALAESTDDILTWYCTAMAITGVNGVPFVVLNGNKPPSRIVEPIIRDKFRGYDFEVENGAIILKERQGIGRFENLSVHEDELRAAIAVISTWGGVNAARL